MRFPDYPTNLDTDQWSDDPDELIREKFIVDAIAEFGWNAMQIEADDNGPEFAYTVGLLSTINHPEIIIFGLEHMTMYTMLETIFDDITKGRSFQDDGLYTGILDHYAIAVRQVDPSQHANYLGYALWERALTRQRNGDLRAVQVFWPDVDGRFPWERGCEKTCIRDQPRLFRPAKQDE